jgi:hypothetical protein
MEDNNTFWGNIGGFINDGLNTVVDVTAGASTIADSWANFGKTEEQLKAEKLEQEVARLKYQAQVNATQTPQTQTGFKIDEKVIFLGGGALVLILLLRGK